MRTLTTTKTRATRVAGSVVGVLVLLFATQLHADIDSWFSDAHIAKAVQHYLSAKLPDNAKRIDVMVKHGVVTLRGKATTLFAAQQAAQIAKTVRGVRAVVDRFTVSSAVKRSDSQMRNAIIDSLWVIPSVDRGEIIVHVKNGTATLRGVVDSWQERIEAGKTAARVAGVIAVDNKLSLAQTPMRNDDKIYAEVRARLFGDAYVDAAYINVRVHQREVYLSGVTSSVAQRERAVYDAWVRGVKGVVTKGLVVDPSTRQTARRERTPIVTDATAKRSLELALAYDPRVPADKVSVEVEANRATLEGTVQSLVAYYAAEQNARNTVGISSVRNLLDVRWPKAPKDSKVEKRLEQSIARDPTLDAHDIDVSVSNGVAYLSGKVNTRLSRWTAEEHARHTRGVVAVVNNLEKRRGPPPMADRTLERAVRANLRFNPFVDSSRISVNARGGVVTLIGRVGSMIARTSAAEAARLAGAKNVRNWITVKPSGS